MQAYRGLPILTCQPARPTRLVGIWPLDHEGSVGEYARLAHAAIDELLAAGRTPVVAGGTGLYLRAALAELGLPPAPRAGRPRRAGRRSTTATAPKRRTAASPSSTRRRRPSCTPNDRRRVVRALELAEVGASLVPADDRLWAEETRHPTLLVGLDVPREELLRRIEQRTAAMFDAGVEDEVRAALAGTGLDHGVARRSGSRRSPSCRATRRSRRDRDPHAPLRRLPAQVDAADSGPRYASTPIAPPTRSPMRFSKWHALGNTYLLVERAETGAPLTAGAGARRSATAQASARTASSRCSPRPTTRRRC